MKLTVAVILMSLTQTSFAQSDQPPNFVCPEKLPSEEARKNALNDFVSWAEERYPALTIADLASLRVKVLEANNCVGTLANIRK